MYDLWTEVFSWTGVVSNASIATVLALGIAALGRLWKNPAALHWLWMLVLVKLLTPPLFLLAIPWLTATQTATKPAELGAAARIAQLERQINEPKGVPNPIKSEAQGSPQRIESQTEPAQPLSTAGRLPLPQTTSLLLWIWIGGSLALVAWRGYRIARFREILRLAQPPDESFLLRATTISRQFGLRRAPQILLLPVRISPLVWSIGTRPKVLLPRELFGRLNLEMQETILTHELVHLRRKDHWVRVLELVATTLCWWHPVAWWACRELRELEEQCCDARVIGLLPNLKRSYAEALLATVEFLADTRQAVPLGASGFSQATRLTRRMKMILQGRSASRIQWPLRCTLLLVGGVILSLSITVLQAEPTSLPDESQSNGKSNSTTANDESAKLEQRLDRMEAMLQKLAETLQVAETSTSAPTNVTTTATSKDSELSAMTSKEWGRELGPALAKIQKQAEWGLQLAKTQLKRKIAAERQAEAVKAAYKSGTVTLDQLLTAQRCVAETRLAYAREVSSLATVPAQRDYVYSLASAYFAAQALNDARDVWKDVHTAYTTSGGEASAEAQAREQFYQFKTQSQRALTEHLKAKSAWEACDASRESYSYDKRSVTEESNAPPPR